MTNQIQMIFDHRKIKMKKQIKIHENKNDLEDYLIFIKMVKKIERMMEKVEMQD